MGNRILKNSTIDANERFVVDIAGRLPVVLLVVDPTDMSVKQDYIYANSQILTGYDGDSAQRYFYTHDRLGSVRLVVDDDGKVKNSYTYDPWGKVIGNETQETVSNDYRFAGYFWDDEPNMYYCIARYYDPELARFGSHDPVAGVYKNPMSLQKYLYCLNDPINKTDPTGRWAYGGAKRLAARVAWTASTQSCALATFLTEAGSPTEILNWLPEYNKFSEMMVHTPGLWDEFEKIALYKPGVGGLLRGEKIYGKNCGEGGTGDGVDPLDDACARHDACYDEAKVGGREGTFGNSPAARVCDRKLCMEAVNADCDSSRTPDPLNCKAAKTAITGLYCANGLR